MNTAAAPRLARLNVRLDPYRACVLCIHGLAAGDIGRNCTAPDTMLLHGTPPPVQAARARGSVCGPDAARLDFPGLQP